MDISLVEETRLMGMKNTSDIFGKLIIIVQGGRNTQMQAELENISAWNGMLLIGQKKHVIFTIAMVDF